MTMLPDGHLAVDTHRQSAVGPNFPARHVFADTQADSAGGDQTTRQGHSSCDPQRPLRPAWARPPRRPTSSRCPFTARRRGLTTERENDDIQSIVGGTTNHRRDKSN